MPDLANLLPSSQTTPSDPKPHHIPESDPDELTSDPAGQTESMDSGKQPKTYARRVSEQHKDSGSCSELDGEQGPRGGGGGESAGINFKSDELPAESQIEQGFRQLKSVQCRVCQDVVSPEEEVLCSVRSCPGRFHLKCAKESLGFSSSKKFKCPRHACFLCKQQYNLWRCIKCLIASHDKCAPFPEYVVHFPDRPGEAICWRHPSDMHLKKKQEVVATNIEEVFSLLPAPSYEEFTLDESWKEETETKLEPHPYVQIKRNVYLVKRKRIDRDSGCRCHPTQCSDACVCRVQCISCSKACHCSEKCTNRPFQKMKKIQIVRTEHCGWGAVAAESIKKEEFIIEYVGEVIDDAMCERRLWDLKDQAAKNFYMCEINKNFVIDATFKGNASRFLNHSCAPNCKLEKWQVEGEVRVGVFASKAIEIGEPLTYDYRFVQFGPEVECHCGAPNCQGYLGTRKRNLFGAKSKSKTQVEVSWGLKRHRTSIATVGIIRN